MAYRNIITYYCLNARNKNKIELKTELARPVWIAHLFQALPKGNVM